MFIFELGFGAHTYGTTTPSLCTFRLRSSCFMFIGLPLGTLEISLSESRVHLLVFVCYNSSSLFHYYLPYSQRIPCSRAFRSGLYQVHCVDTGREEALGLHFGTWYAHASDAGQATVSGRVPGLEGGSRVFSEGFLGCNVRDEHVRGVKIRLWS
jgi:hypothetical protein